MSFTSDFTPLPPSQTIEFKPVTEMLDELLIMQYKNSPNLYTYIEAFTSELGIISQAVKDTINLRQLADAYGAQLDVIGEIVGQSRVVPGAVSLGYFGFYDDPQSAFPSIADAATPTIGGFYKGNTDKDSANFVMDDTQYKSAIYAKILKNQTNCCVEDVIQYIDLITNKVLDTEITEEANQGSIYIHNDLEQIDRIMLGLFIDNVRPAGTEWTLRDNLGFIAIRPTFAGSA